MASTWAHNAIPSVSLDASGLIALADLTTMARRTALKGNAYYADALLLCPGMHRQQAATLLNGGEYPITANMTSGYVFRVENQATVQYLQSVGKTGHLTTLSVAVEKIPLQWLRPFLDLSSPCMSMLFYVLPALFTMMALSLITVIQDCWGVTIFVMLIMARIINVILIRRRCDATWHGAKEPGQVGDLIILLSQDRWIRMRGLTDDLKAVTSGEWLRETSFIEGSLEGCGILVVYLSAALISNTCQITKVTFTVLLLVNAGLLTLSNEYLGSFRMKGRIIKVTGSPIPYKRRLDLAEQLVKESGRKDWALKMGMIAPDESSSESEKSQKSNVVQV